MMLHALNIVKNILQYALYEFQNDIALCTNFKSALHSLHCAFLK